MKKIDLVVQTLDEGPKTIKAYRVDEDFAIHHSIDPLTEHYWRATHIPSGLSLGFYFRKRDDCLAATRRFRECFESRRIDCSTLHLIPKTRKSSRRRRVHEALNDFRFSEEMSNEEV